MTSQANEASIADIVKSRVNKSFEELYRVNAAGEYVPYVCLVCDEFLKPKTMKILRVSQLRLCANILQPGIRNDIDPHGPLATSYTYFGDCGDSVEDDDREWIEEMLLSSRGSYIYRTDGRQAEGFAVCASCKYGLDRVQMPKFAIANNYCFGSPPACLTELTEVELALLTPVKTYGYCFTYTGGVKKQLKGSLSYYKVNISSIARTVAQFDVLGLNKDIVLILHGKLTAEQKRKAREKNKVRPQNVLIAVEWLLLNNEEWRIRDINMDDLRQQLRNPLLIDQSTEVMGDQDTESSNIESTESFEVYFPDGSVSSTTGGQEELQKFQELVNTAQANGYDLELRNELFKEAVHDFKDNNLVNACLLQFPYGRGGLHEVRLKGDGSSTNNTNLEDYLGHLSLVSQPEFHEELFCLILFNMHMKMEMVRTAGWKVRRNLNAVALSEELTQEDIEEAISARSTGRYQSSNHRGRLFLNSLDAIARSIPHSTDAAKRARRDAEAHQHYFGMPSMFLTVAPDDDNSFLVQVLSGITVDDDEEIASLTNDELVKRATQRTSLRLKYPGICSFYFELALDIILKDVVGWDLENQCATEEAGLFGFPEAIAASVEEQGRSTLHTHIQVWIKEYNEFRDALHSSSSHERRNAKRKIEQTVDAISSTSLFNAKRCRYDHGSFGAFPHICTEKSDTIRKAPAVVDDQQLRYLRHRIGQNSTGKMFAYCPDCTMSWTNEEFVASYLLNGIIVPGLTDYPDLGVRRLKAMCVEHQKEIGGNIDKVIVDAAYNHHVHTKGCFYCRSNKAKFVPKNGGNTKKRVRSSKCDECRYRSPSRKKQKTMVQNASTDTVKWYFWDGGFSERNIKEICVKRHTYDAFQNVCCPAVSHSKLTCNSNISALMPGPVGQYTVKYNFKDTNKDDTEPYSGVSKATQRALTAAQMYESPRSESIRRLLSASFAHQKNNVLHGTMASYLVRNKQRFIFSHQTVWCPLRDLESLLHGGSAFSTVALSGDTPFYQNAALNYLCRPRELEHTRAFDFYSWFEVVRCTSLNEGILYKFVNDVYRHPSYREKRQSFLQGVQKRKKECLIKIFQYDFPDTAEFGGSILSASTPVTEVTEKYAKLALLLFYPFRILDDLLSLNSYTLKFREAVADGIIDVKAKSFLQNVQDARSNCFRMARLEDDLQRDTDMFQPADVAYDNADNAGEDDDENNSPGIHGPELDRLLDLFDEEAAATITNNNVVFASSVNTDIPPVFKLDAIRQKGVLQCGYDSLAKMNYFNQTHEKVYEVSSQAVAASTSPAVPINAEDFTVQQRSPKQNEIGRLLLTRTSRRSRTFKEITKKDTVVDVLEASGSVKSILDWARKAELDEGQKRAFEIFVSSFILTFYADAPRGTLQGDHDASAAYLREKQKLKKLGDNDRRDSDQLICLLHGPGGCGKTTVIDLLLEYAREYCSYIEDFSFSSRTIVVTAMSGVAATLLLGETTHSAVYLNKKTALEAENIEIWADTRLLIVDEVSFASKHEFIKLHQNLRRLKQQLFLPYGGLNIIFSGDFRQLEPCSREGKKAVYREDCPEFKDWVNCYLELHGMHRFQKDEEWGALLLRFRNGEVTVEDIERINERVVVNNTTKDKESIPDNIKYSTYFNRDRDAINAALFEERCKYVYEKTGHTDDSLIIFSDEVQVRNSSEVYVPFQNTHAFWENCAEDDVKPPKSSGRMDPVLKLYHKCRVMLPFNKNVKKGEANGTQAEVEKVILKPGVVPNTVMLGGKIPIAAVKASEVEKIILNHSNDRIQPSTFCVEPKNYTFIAKVLKPKALRTRKAPREKIRMKAKQIPLLINNATTGHKLQGSGVDNLFVHNWSNVTNWVYVMLSRVKTRAGLFCRKPLGKDLRRFAIPEGLWKMLQKFEQRRPTYWSEQQYEEIFGA